MGVYSEIKKFKKSLEDDDYIAYYFYRKLSAPFSTLFVKLRFSANFVTVLGFLADIIAIYFMFTQQWIVAAVLIQLAVIWDHSDGEVARYWNSKKKNPERKYYGQFLDDALGTVSFVLVVFFAGYVMNEFWIGFAAMFGLFMTIATAAMTSSIFPNKDEISKKAEQKLVGKRRGRIGFSSTIQRIIVTLVVLFGAFVLGQYILLAFAILINAFWIMKFWVYRKY